MTAPMPNAYLRTFEIPTIPVTPEIEFISFTASEIKAKTDDELEAVLSGEFKPGHPTATG
jgi:hypothetical protein